MTFNEIISKIPEGQKKVTLQLEVISYDSQTGEKLSKPHNVEYEVKYLEGELKNLSALGYTVTLIEAAGADNNEVKKRKNQQNG